VNTWFVISRTVISFLLVKFPAKTQVIKRRNGSLHFLVVLIPKEILVLGQQAKQKC